MQITKIRIENFKSIKEISFDINKYGDSYTTMLVGINESGKSNVLEAMSFFNTPDGEFDYNVIHNQKDEENKPVDLWFDLSFENIDTCVKDLRNGIDNGELLNFEVTNIVKNIYLQDGETEFSHEFSFTIENLTKELFIKKYQKNVKTAKGENKAIDAYTISTENDEEESFEELTLELFEKYFSNRIQAIIEYYQPIVSRWEPSEKYLVSEVDLNDFKDNINSNIPLRNIFYIAGYKDLKSIQSEIERINNTSLRRKLGGILGKNVTDYVKKIWNHDIIIDIEILESGMCTVSIRDGGKANEYNYHKMSVRSEGFKQFMSLILSLSVETKFSSKRNNLILIDEPEAHLHPSGIRDLRKELLAIGENNYLFVSTHSPFLVDRKDKERNVIIRKNKSAETEKVHIDAHTEAIDDEVLREAFGIEVYKDLLNPHSILVEGASDKKIIQKAFAIKDINGYGITNGYGSNIDTLASKLNDTGISLLVVLDDDSDGKEYKNRIISIGGSYSNNNVFTIRDISGNIVSDGTIEDTLDKEFLKSKLQEVFEDKFSGEIYDFVLAENAPYIKQVKIFLQQKAKSNKVTDEFLIALKTKISDDFNPTKSAFSSDSPLLENLIIEIINKLS